MAGKKSAASGRKRKSQRRLAGPDGGAYLLDSRWRDARRADLTRELELLKARYAAGKAYKAAEKAMRALGASLDRVWRAHAAYGSPHRRGDGRGELMWQAAIAALAPEPDPGTGGIYATVLLQPFWSAERELLFRFHNVADDDLFAEVLHPGVRRADALRRVTVMRAAMRKRIKSLPWITHMKP